MLWQRHGSTSAVMARCNSYRLVAVAHHIRAPALLLRAAALDQWIAPGIHFGDTRCNAANNAVAGGAASGAVRQQASGDKMVHGSHRIIHGCGNCIAKFSARSVPQKKAGAAWMARRKRKKKAASRSLALAPEESISSFGFSKRKKKKRSWRRHGVGGVSCGEEPLNIAHRHGRLARLARRTACLPPPALDLASANAKAMK